MNSSLFKIARFFGIALMLAGASGAYILMRNVMDSLLIMNGGAQMLPALKAQAAGWTAAVGSILLLLSRNGSVKLPFTLFFGVNGAICASSAYLFYIGSSLTSDITLISWLYLWGQVGTVLPLVLVWGYANQLFTYRSAAVQYPLLGAMSGLALFATGPFTSWAMTTSHTYALNFAVTAGLSVLCVLLFAVLNSLKQEQPEPGRHVKWGYWVALAAVLAAIKVAPHLLSFLFKWGVKQSLPDPAAFVAFMGEFSVTQGQWGVIGGVFSLLLGIAIAMRSSITTVSAALILGGMLIAALQTLCAVQHQPGSLMPMATSYALFGALLGVLKYLKELMFFAIPLDRRFSSKLLLDFLLVALAGAAASTFQSGALIVKGTIPNSIDLFTAVIVGVLLIGLAGVYRIHRSN